jgi:hypothetical protein
VRSLDRFWQALESVPGAAAIPAWWDWHCGEDYEVARRFLLVTDILGTRYPCPRANGAWCPRRIVELSDGEFVAVCPNERRRCEDIPLRKSEVLAHRVDLDGLVRSVSGCLGFKPQTAAAQAPGTWAVGLARRPQQACPVYLLIHQEGADFRRALDRLIAARGRDFCVLSPTAKHIDAPTDETLTRNGVRFAALNETVAWLPPGRFSAVRPLFAAEDMPRETEAANRFQESGQGWRIVFAGKAFDLKDKVGLNYIRVLLANPGKVYSPAELRTAVYGDEPVPATQVRESPIDTQALRQYKAEVARLAHERESAADGARRAELGRSIEALTRQIAGATRFGGRMRETNVDLERQRKTVAKAIQRCLAEIQPLHLDLWRHLINAIHTGNSIVYSPLEKTSWVT